MPVGSGPTNVAGKIAFYEAGWQIHADNLAAYLAGRERGDSEPRWDELVPPYQDLAAEVSGQAPGPEINI